MLTTEKEFLQYIDTALMKYLDYYPVDIPKFSKTLKAYLLHLGISSERSFKMFDSFDLPKDTLEQTTSDGKTEQLDTSLISLTICMGLEKLSQIVNIATKEGYFMGGATKIKLAEEWTSNLIAIKNKNTLSTSTSTSSLPTSAIEHKTFPDFELKKFTTFDGNINDF